MQSTQSATHTDGAEPAPPPERDRALATMFRENELVWLVGEQYEPVGGFWSVDVVRQGLQGRWMRQRYRYDQYTGVIYFLGERPASDEELASLRHSGKVFPVGPLQKQAS